MYSSFTSQKNTPHFFDIEMKIQILLCLCIGKALAFLANEESPKTMEISNLDSPTRVQPLPTLAIVEQPNDGVKETLEPAASAWGNGYRRWGGGYGWRHRSYGYGGYYGGYRYPAWGGYGYRKWR